MCGAGAHCEPPPCRGEDHTWGHHSGPAPTLPHVLGTRAAPTPPPSRPSASGEPAGGTLRAWGPERSRGHVLLRPSVHPRWSLLSCGPILCPPPLSMTALSRSGPHRCLQVSPAQVPEASASPGNVRCRFSGPANGILWLLAQRVSAAALAGAPKPTPRPAPGWSGSPSPRMGGWTFKCGQLSWETTSKLHPGLSAGKSVTSWSPAEIVTTSPTQGVPPCPPGEPSSV